MHCQWIGRSTLAGLALSLTLAASLSYGQQDPTTKGLNALGSQFLPARRELKQSLAQAAKAIEEKSYADAAGLLGEFLQDDEFEDYFLDGNGQGSLKGEAQRQLQQLPKAGRESYELQFGADAKALLNTALEEQNPAKLAEVVRLYFHTKAGHEAALVWGRYLIDNGQPLAAAMILQRLLDQSPDAAAYEPELSLLAAISWRLGQRPELAQAALVALQKRTPQATFTLGGQATPLFAANEDPLKWLDGQIGQLPAIPSPFVNQWVMHRGDPTRNAGTNGSLPLAVFRWHKFLGRDEGDDELLARSAKQFQTNGIGAIPIVSPLVVNDTILMRTAERLMAVDLKSGKFLWRYPWDDQEEEWSNVEGTIRAPAAALQRERDLSQRLWEDATYAGLTSDGESVFLVDELGYTSTGPSRAALVLPGGLQRRNPRLASNVNKLVSLNLAKQGKLNWTVGGETGEDEPQLAEVFFLGAPLLADQRLYAIVEQNGELRLVVLDPQTGKLQWSQQLAHVDTMTILVDSTRRLAGATPSLADGVLICPTSAASVVAVDLSQRKLLWGYRYPTSIQRTPGNWYGYTQPQRPIGSHWVDASATIAQGRVLLTPPESEELICLDMLTGKPAWKSRSRTEELNEALFVACIHDGRIVLVGKNRITALKLTDGTPAWSAPIKLEGELPSGRGFLAGGDYYLPTTYSEILKIDLAQGQIVSRGATDRILGNLVCYQDQLVSQNYDGLSTYYQVDALRQQLVEKLKATPEDPLALAQHAQVLLHDGKTDEALTALRSAYQKDSQNDDTRSLLVSTLLAVLKNDFSKQNELAAEIEPLLDQPRLRREFLRLQAKAFQKSGEKVAAFQALIGLAELSAGERADAQNSGATLETVEPERRLRFDRWVQTQLHEIHRAVSPEERSVLDARLVEVLGLLPQNPTAEQLQRLVNYYGWHPACDAIRLKLAALRLENNDLLAAELLVMRLAEQDKGTVAGQALALLAQINEKAGHGEFAARCYTQLAERFPNIPVRNQETGKQLWDAAAQRKALAPLLQAGSWPSGKVTVTEEGEAPSVLGLNSTMQRHYPLPLTEAAGALSQGIVLKFDSVQTLMSLVDSQGNQIAQYSLRRPDNRRPSAPLSGVAHAHAVGHLMLVSLGQELVAVDTLHGSTDAADYTLWRQDLLTLPSDNSSQLRGARTQVVASTWAMPRSVAVSEPDRILGCVAVLSEDAACYIRGRELVCVHPQTGEVQWERVLPESGYDLFGDEELLFIVPPPRRSEGGDEGIVLSVADGRELGKRRVDRLDVRWRTLGRNVLTGKQDGREFLFAIYDAWEQKELWSMRCPYGTRGTLIGRDEVAFLQPNGKLVIASIATGKVLVDQQVSAETKLLNIFVLRSESQYFVQCDTIGRKDDLLSNISVQPSPGTEQCRIVTGRLYAFDRATGQPSWQSPAYISQFGFMVDQPTELPVLAFLRTKVPTDGQGTGNNQRRTKTSAMVLDRRDGRLLCEHDNLPIQANVYDVVGDRHNNTVTLSLSLNNMAQASKSFILKFTDDARPPEPPLQMGSAASSTTASMDKTLETLGRMLPEGLMPRIPTRTPGARPNFPDRPKF